MDDLRKNNHTNNKVTAGNDLSFLLMMTIKIQILIKMILIKYPLAWKEFI